MKYFSKCIDETAGIIYIVDVWDTRREPHKI